MNLENINTPEDLVKENTTPTDKERVVELMKEFGYDDSKEIIIWLVDNMRNYHMYMSNKLFQEGDENGMSWCSDTGKLSIVLDTLKSVL